MQFKETSLQGVYLISATRMHDKRGSFSRIYDESIFAAHGLPTYWPQHNLSYNEKCGTLRGMHFQTHPHPEPKLVRCLQGSVFDVVVDLRLESPTYCKWTSYELSAANGEALYIPAGCAHGFITLEDNSELLYLMGENYSAAHASGVRWNDTAFDINWPMTPAIMNDKDSSWPDFKP